MTSADTRLVRLCSALGLGDDPASILAPLRALYADLDHELSARAAGLELPCEAGCDACCHESVFVSAPELLAIAAELLATRTEAELRAIVEAHVRLAEQFADELELLETIGPGAERDEVAARVKFTCPLLGPGGRCTVYAARELNARTFGQSWDGRAKAPYGCERTHARLAVIEEGPRLVDAREARRRLAATLPGTEVVAVFPWWFARYGALLLP